MDCFASLAMTAADLRRVEAGDRLRLEIFLHAVAAPLAAVAGLLVATERRRAIVRHALQIDVAGAPVLEIYERRLLTEPDDHDSVHKAARR